jgi:hypothetical protein
MSIFCLIGENPEVTVVEVDADVDTDPVPVLLELAVEFKATDPLPLSGIGVALLFITNQIISATIPKPKNCDKKLPFIFMLLVIYELIFIYLKYTKLKYNHERIVCFSQRFEISR